MAGFPAVILGAPTAAPSASGVRVASGESQFNQPLKLPEGNLLFIKVSSEDTGGAFFLAERQQRRSAEAHAPRGRRGILLSGR